MRPTQSEAHDRGPGEGAVWTSLLTSKLNVHPISVHPPGVDQTVEWSTDLQTVEESVRHDSIERNVRHGATLTVGSVSPWNLRPTQPTTNRRRFPS